VHDHTSVNEDAVKKSAEEIDEKKTSGTE
jgi:hypothetical protein